MDKSTTELLADWMEKFDERQIPFTALLGEPRPDYARQFNTERVEPFATLYDTITSVIRDLEPDDEDEPFFEYQPTERMRDLYAVQRGLHDQAFRQVPNPEYDAERAEAWEKKHRRRPFNQTQIRVGQSYNPTTQEAT